jgi:hypothetical protein
MITDKIQYSRRISPSELENPQEMTIFILAFFAKGVVMDEPRPGQCDAA